MQTTETIQKMAQLTQAQDNLALATLGPCRNIGVLANQIGKDALVEVLGQEEYDRRKGLHASEKAKLVALRSAYAALISDFPV